MRELYKHECRLVTFFTGMVALLTLFVAAVTWMLLPNMAAHLVAVAERFAWLCAGVSGVFTAISFFYGTETATAKEFPPPKT